MKTCQDEVRLQVVIAGLDIAGLDVVLIFLAVN